MAIVSRFILTEALWDNVMVMVDDSLLEKVPVYCLKMPRWYNQMFDYMGINIFVTDYWAPRKQNEAPITSVQTLLLYWSTI